VPGLVTVVVTTRNSAATLTRCLRSIRAQSYGALELVVVDNGSTDGTPELAAEHADRVLDAGPERSAQRNRGVEAGFGEHVLIVDSDMMLASEVVEQCVAVARTEGVAAVVVPERSVGEGFVAAVKALERSCYLGDDTIEAPRFFLRETYDRYGGYDEELTGPEDWDLPARMKATERIGRVTAEIVHLEGRIRLVPLLRKKFYYGKDAYRYLRRHPDLARRQVVPLRPAFVRHWRRLAERPVLGAAVIGLKTAELAAGGLGLLSAAVERRRR
jgi:glycosyltransferase involved in cell wall biosynthesis